MEEYLKILDDELTKKNIHRFATFPDVKPFKIIKAKRGRIKEEIQEMLLKNPKKYAGRHIAIVGLETYPEGFITKHGRLFKPKKDNTIFSVFFTIYRIHKDGQIDTYSGDSNTLRLDYLPDDLEKHPFKIKNINTIIQLVYKKKILATPMGISVMYKEFEKEYNKLKENKNIESNSMYKKERTSQVALNTRLKILKETLILIINRIKEIDNYLIQFIPQEPKPKPEPKPEPEPEPEPELDNFPICRRTVASYCLGNVAQIANATSGLTTASPTIHCHCSRRIRNRSISEISSSKLCEFTGIFFCSLMDLRGCLVGSAVNYLIPRVGLPCPNPIIWPCLNVKPLV
jgi:hypothetical protein